MIAGAASANRGYISSRADTRWRSNIKTAIEQAKQFGLLGKTFSDSALTLKFTQPRRRRVVCGEDRAYRLHRGERGFPRVSPLTVNKRTCRQAHGSNTLKPTQTFFNYNHGAEWFRGLGKPGSNAGTKAFALTGNIENTGLIEVPRGTTLREIIYDIGGGCRGGAELKAVQIGGPSGGCLTREHLDLPLDFDSLKQVGAIIGSGGLVVMDEHTCMVEVARFFMNFTQNESCGKCVPCREGTKRMLEILERIVEGKGEPEDIDTLAELSDMIINTALCGLGKTAPNPVRSTLQYFRDEYEAHINGTCRRPTAEAHEDKD